MLYLRIHGKGDKERIVSISEGTVKHLKNYIKLFHNQDTPDAEYLFYTLIHNQANPMSPGNVERIINKYAEKIRPSILNCQLKFIPICCAGQEPQIFIKAMWSLNWCQEFSDMHPLRLPGNYAKPSLEMLKSVMDRSNPELNAEQPLWPDDEVELARIFGIR